MLVIVVSLARCPPVTRDAPFRRVYGASAGRRGAEREPARYDAGLGDRTFATGSAGHQDLYVVAGSYGLHLSHTRQGPIPLEQMVALAREMLDALKRPPR
jgi:hypothetical protein